MPDQQALYTLLNLNVDKNAPLISVYSEQAGARLHYTCEFIFNHILKINFNVVTDITAWENSKGYRINYSQKQFPESLHVSPQGLLTEQGISKLKPTAVFKNNQLYFYENAMAEKNNSLHFDIFSAVFYLISRYEEWQTFAPDKHGRFEAKESCLYAHNRHLKPVVDEWVYELKSFLETMYTGLSFPKVNFKTISTLDVDNLYAYKFKGFVRTVGASMKDLLKLDLKNLSGRLRVLSGSEKDPFDIYEEVSQFCNELNIPLIFFFLFKNGTTYDRTVDPDSPAFTNVFSILKNKKIQAGIHPSYNAAFEPGALKKEIAGFSEKWNEKVMLSRQHFLRFNIRTTPKLLMEQGIRADFTMGFASTPGFRAGTTQPFFYYDFDSEKKSELLFTPFCAMDGAYFVYDKIKPETALRSLLEIAAEIKKVNGLFVSVFHERTFSNHLYSGFGTLYKNLHLKLKEL